MGVHAVFALAVLALAAAWRLDRRRLQRRVEALETRSAALAAEVAELRRARDQLGELQLRLTSLARMLLPPEHVPPADPGACFARLEGEVERSRRKLSHLERGLGLARRRLRQRTRHLEALQAEVNRLRQAARGLDAGMREQLASLEAERNLLRQRVDELARLVRDRHPPSDEALREARRTIDDLRLQLRATQQALAATTEPPSEFARDPADAPPHR